VTKRKGKPLAVRCLEAELTGIDLWLGGLVRRNLVIEDSACPAIEAAINSGRAFILRRCEKPVPPYTHLVSWPGTGLLLCHLEED
jgi:hypothetical protein